MQILTLTHRLCPVPACEIVLVIDILRATSSIVEGLAAGALSITPAASVAEARRLARISRAVLVGEVEGERPVGFALGNSPLEFTPQSVGNRHVVMTTTNGTPALVAAAECPNVACLALTNRAAMVEWLRRTAPPSVTLMCSGDEGLFSAEDLAGAGALIVGLQRAGIQLELDDLSQVAESWFRANLRDLHSMLTSARHGKKLLELGYAADLQACAQLDSQPIVPVFRDGHLRHEA